MLSAIRSCQYNDTDRIKIKGFKIIYHRSGQINIRNIRPEQRKFPGVNGIT